MLSNDEIDNELNQMYGKESESEDKIVKAIKLTDNIFSIGIKKAVLINEDASIGAVIKSMQTADSSCIIIIKNNKISGIFTSNFAQSSSI